MPAIQTRDGCKLHVEVTGEGRPVVLIPGLGGSAKFWSGIAPKLSERFRVVQFDHRGAGRSDRPVATYSVEGLAADLVDILDQLSIDRAHLVGHSTGGAIAQVMAIDHAERVNRLVLSATWDKPTRHFEALFAARLRMLEVEGPEAYARLTQLIGFPPDWIDQNPRILPDAVAAAAADLHPISVAMERLRMLFRFDRSAELDRIVAPTLVIGSRDDMIIAFGRSEALSKQIRGARLLARDGGHFFPRVDPARFVQDLAFLTESAA